MYDMLARIAYKQRIVKRDELFTPFYPVMPDFDARSVQIGEGAFNTVTMMVDYLTTAEDGDRRVNAHINYLRDES